MPWTSKDSEDFIQAYNASSNDMKQQAEFAFRQQQAAQQQSNFERTFAFTQEQANKKDPMMALNQQKAQQDIAESKMRLRQQERLAKQAFGNDNQNVQRQVGKITSGPSGLTAEYLSPQEVQKQKMDMALTKYNSNGVLTPEEDALLGRVSQVSDSVHNAALTALKDPSAVTPADAGQVIANYDSLPILAKQQLNTRTQAAAQAQGLYTMPSGLSSKQQDEYAKAMADIPLDKTKKINDISVSGQGDVVKKFYETRTNFRVASSLLSNLVSGFKGYLDSVDPVPNAQGIQGGIIPGFRGRAQDALKLPGYERIAALKGATTQTALAEMPILTGSTRMVQSIYGLIRESLPTDLDTNKGAAQKIHQHLRDIYGIQKAVEQELKSNPDLFNALPTTKVKYEDGIIRDTIPSSAFSIGRDRINQEVQNFTPDELAALDALTLKILATPKVKSYTMTSNAGVKRLKSGVTIEFVGNSNGQ